MMNVGIEHMGGDMFEEVPQGDAIFMKVVNFPQNMLYMF